MTRNRSTWEASTLRSMQVRISLNCLIPTGTRIIALPGISPSAGQLVGFWHHVVSSADASTGHSQSRLMYAVPWLKLELECAAVWALVSVKFELRCREGTRCDGAKVSRPRLAPQLWPGGVRGAAAHAAQPVQGLTFTVPAVIYLLLTHNGCLSAGCESFDVHCAPKADMCLVLDLQLLAVTVISDGAASALWCHQCLSASGNVRCFAVSSSSSSNSSSASTGADLKNGTSYLH